MTAYIAQTKTFRYYLLRGRQGGRYYSHRIGSTVHTVEEPLRARCIFEREADADQHAQIEGRVAWEVVPWDSPHVIPMAW